MCFYTSEASNLEKEFGIPVHNSYSLVSFSLKVFWWKLSGSVVGAGRGQVLVRDFLYHLKNGYSNLAFTWISWNPAVDFKQFQSLLRTLSGRPPPLEEHLSWCLKTSFVCFCTLRKMLFPGPDFLPHRAQWDEYGQEMSECLFPTKTR